MHDVLKYDLPTTAARAAVEIDLLIAEESIGTKSIEDLIDFIGKKIVPGNKVSGDNVSTDDLWLRECLYEFSEKPKNSHVSQYGLDIKLLHDEFSNFASLPKDKLKNLGNFCCKLSQAAIARTWQYGNPYISYAA